MILHISLRQDHLCILNKWVNLVQLSGNIELIYVSIMYMTRLPKHDKYFNCL